jgi:hypothetical protein
MLENKNKQGVKGCYARMILNNLKIPPTERVWSYWKNAKAKNVNKFNTTLEGIIKKRKTV